MLRQIFVGFDQREAAAYAVARYSIKRHLSQPIPIHGLVLSDLKARGLYTRPIEYRPSSADRPIMWDTISDAPMSTEHACARFLTPNLAKSGWALFMDGDILVRDDLAKMFDKLDPKYAVYCVKHSYVVSLNVKMDSQIQTQYERKLWSSFMVFNCDHPVNKLLTVGVVNSIPGRDLHRFYWLKDNEIGELGKEWNWLAGVSDQSIDPRCVHFTLGTPDMFGYEDAPFADEWRKELDSWAA